MPSWLIKKQTGRRWLFIFMQRGIMPLVSSLAGLLKVWSQGIKNASNHLPVDQNVVSLWLNLLWRLVMTFWNQFSNHSLLYTTNEFRRNGRVWKILAILTSSSTSSSTSTSSLPVLTRFYPQLDSLTLDHNLKKCVTSRDMYPVSVDFQVRVR